MDMKYLKNKVEVKGLKIEWFKSVELDKKEHFVFILTNGDNKQTFNFTNSIMEFDLTHNLLSLRWDKNFKKCLPKYWGGYDEVTSLKELDLKRIEFLLYGFLNCIYNDYIIISDCDFVEFVEEFGYNENLRKGEIVYNKLKENKFKIDSLKLNSNQWDIFKLFGEEEEEEEIKKVLGVIY